MTKKFKEEELIQLMRTVYATGGDLNNYMLVLPLGSYQKSEGNEVNKYHCEYGTFDIEYKNIAEDSFYFLRKEDIF